jgi:hypothetical protein
MNDEVARKPTWEEQRAAIDQAVKEKIGDATVENFLSAAGDASDLTDEYHNLAAWYTDTHDAAVLRLHSDYSSSAALSSAARTDVAAANPAKFARFRELEKMLAHQNAVHQHIANAAHAGVIESTLRQRTWL